MAFAKCAGKIAFRVKAYFWQWVSDIMQTWKEIGKKPERNRKKSEKKPERNGGRRKRGCSGRNKRKVEGMGEDEGINH